MRHTIVQPKACLIMDHFSVGVHGWSVFVFFFFFLVMYKLHPLHLMILIFSFNVQLKSCTLIHQFIASPADKCEVGEDIIIHYI